MNDLEEALNGLISDLKNELKTALDKANIQAEVIVGKVRSLTDSYSVSDSILVKIGEFKRSFSIEGIKRASSYMKDKDVVEQISKITLQEFNSGLGDTKHYPGEVRVKTSGLSFGQAIEVARSGGMIARSGWNGKGMFVFMQVPSEISFDVIPKMTSLPQKVKDEFASRKLNLFYSNQFAIAHSDNRINGWTPSPSDSLAEDWFIFRES